uniref:Uncharacterized protein n=1 Tax=Tanacetum cinerariifolium TaxID=118510 RepID=A0A6L2P0W9_TANCI|nr:hypothetical protein [Tanacetum cinerariifolium]
MIIKAHKCRKLEVKMNIDGHEGDGNNMDMLDYHRIDPAPNSKASIRHGPIQHDAPLGPYIPKPPPPEPDQQNHLVGFP